MKPSEVARHRAVILEALEALERVLRSGFNSGASSVFFGMTPDEVQDELVARREEAELHLVLLLVAAFEGLVMSESKARRTSNSADATTRALRRLFASNESRLALEDVLDAWHLTATARAIGEFKQVLPFRHWLAHGRHWHYQGPIHTVTPERVMERGRAMATALGFTL